MQNEEIQYEEYINEIGYFAKKLDNEMTIFERMKITKSTMCRILMAMGIYVLIMVLFILLM